MAAIQDHIKTIHEGLSEDLPPKDKKVAGAALALLQGALLDLRRIADALEDRVKVETLNKQ